jgi:hypothetical protein
MSSHSILPILIDGIAIDPNGPGPGPNNVWFIWPDSNWEKKVSDTFFETTEQLQTHWTWNSLKVTKVAGEGHLKCNWRKCMGVIRCSAVSCQRLVRPQTTDARLREQLKRLCHKCNQPLLHVPCDARSKIITNSDTLERTFAHIGTHRHLRPPHLHIDPAALKTFNAVIQANPRATPAQLAAGTTLSSGAPGAPVSEIDPALVNRGRVRYQRRAALSSSHVRGPKSGGDKFLEDYHKFLDANPDWVIDTKMESGLFLVTLQSAYMKSRLLKETVKTEAVNGFVTDACHGFFKDGLLFVTSTYVPDLRMWTPVLMAYSRGEDMMHYRQYFRLFMESMLNALGNKELRDEMVAQVSV